uniref:SH3 domain-containing protein n=1 Tax=Amphimedon queenslandica TaxID=400682 RepID=A0A1X7UJ45_AMPQE
MIAVSDDHGKLRSLGNILMELEETKPLAQDIINDYDKLLVSFGMVPKPSSVTTAVVTQFTSGTVNAVSSPKINGDFYFNAAYQSKFDEIRGSFIILCDEIVLLISRQSKASVAEVKSFIQRSFPELSNELSDADSIEGIMNVAVKNCRVNNISILKMVTKRFKITEAKPLILQYEDEVKTLSESLQDFLSQNQPKHFQNCKTIQFTLGWEPNEHSLDDICNLLEEAFKELNKRIIVRSIHRGNSIIIICYGPHHLLAALLLEAQDNLTVLMKEFSLIRLTIGHYTVYDKRIRCKVQDTVTVMNNECLAEEIKLADGEEQELRTLLDYKEGSIFEEDKQLNIFKERKDYIERTLQTPESKLKVKLLTREKLINKIFKSKKSETQLFKNSFLINKTGREEELVKYKKKIKLLQEQLMSQKTNIYTRYGYHGIWSDDLSFSEGEQLEIYKKGSFWWKGRSLVSDDEGSIPSSCVYSMLESLQLLEFILSVEEVSLPILQKIRNDSSSNDEKASLFLETINDDPIMIPALRQDKKHDEGVTGRVSWDSDRVVLHSPSPVQSNEVISNINNNHKKIVLSDSSTNSTVSLLSSTKLHTLNLRKLVVQSTPLTNDCIQYLCILLTNNETIKELIIIFHSISDTGVSNICQALEHNSTLTSLYLYNNPLITSTSGQALSHLLLNNSSLVILDLRYTALSTESILLILQSLMDNKSITRLKLDNRHEKTCINAYRKYYLIRDRVVWWY